jgi:signal transduction histidine kinase
MTFLRRPVRSRPIRLFLILMLAVPLVSLVALWAFAASITVRGAISDHTYNASVTSVTAAVEPLTLELPAEREASYLWLLSGRKSSDVSVLAARKLVDGAVPTVKSALRSSSLFTDSRPQIDALFAQLAQLGRIRAAVDSGAMSPAAAFQAYDGIMDAEFQFFESAIQYRVSSLAEVSIGAIDGAYAYEMASREATLVAGALADRGQMSPSARQLFASSAASRSMLMNDTLIYLTPNMRGGYVSIVNSPEYHQYQAMEDKISAGLGSSDLMQVNADAFAAASTAYMSGMINAELQSGTALAAISASTGDRQVTEAVLAGGAGLLAVVVSVILLLWFGRKVTRDLSRLDDSVRSMAQERLPRVVQRLRQGDDVDVLAESPPPDTSTIQEIDRIAESFATVQTAAVGAAVDQARMRKGVNQVFLNISRRSQSLLHRQLRMLDSMERRTSEPGVLADLFRLDHLTTRMRRHAEGLIILSGATPGRGWRDPVPVVDVLRAAVAEVEDYVRVDVVSESRDRVAGNVVNDVAHLVAELIENATAFSPPNTRVEVRADRVGAGVVAEIEDRGLGLSAEDLADINRRLASPPEFDLADSEQLGLFVVGRLAARHDIKVSLRPSAYGGITAILLLPFGVIVRDEETSLPDDPRNWPPAAAAAPNAAPPALPGRLTTAGASARPGERPRPEVPGISPAAAREVEQSAPPARAALPPPRVAPVAAPSSWNGSAITPWPDALRPASARRPEQPEQPERPERPERPDGRRADGGAVQPLVSPYPSPSPSASRAPVAARRPGPVVSGPVVSGAVSSGAVSSGAVSSGAVSSGAVSSGAVSSGAVSSGTHLGMPIRVPQASLAPPLRARPELGWWTTTPEEPEVDERPPEVTRNMMALMQQGWQRGRVDDLDHPEGAPSNGTD